MPRIGKTAGEYPVAEGVVDGFVNDNTAQWHIARVDTFGEGNQIRGDIPVVYGKPGAGASETGHDLIGDEHDTVFLGQFPHSLHVFGRGHVYASGTWH